MATCVSRRRKPPKLNGNSLASCAWVLYLDLLRFARFEETLIIKPFVNCSFPTDFIVSTLSLLALLRFGCSLLSHIDLPPPPVRIPSSIDAGLPLSSPVCLYIPSPPIASSIFNSFGSGGFMRPCFPSIILLPIVQFAAPSTHLQSSLFLSPNTLLECLL